jgi:hypothetical protein
LTDNNSICEKYVFRNCSDHFDNTLGLFKKKFFKNLIVSKIDSAAFSNLLVIPSKKIKVNPKYTKSQCHALIKSMKSTRSQIKIYGYNEGILFFKSDIFYLKKYSRWFANSKILKSFSDFDEEFKEVEILSNIHSLNNFSNFYEINNFFQTAPNH